MPEVKANSAADRVLSSPQNMRPRGITGNLILEPRDAMETRGDATDVSPDGNTLVAVGGDPLLYVGRVETVTGWNAYVGPTPGVPGPTKQNSAPLPVDRSSFAGYQPIFPGDLAPVGFYAARIPRPEAPLFVAEPAEVLGYPESTESEPYFLSISFGIDGKHGPLSPAVLVPPVANGQLIRAQLLREPPGFATHIGIWLTEPGTSTSSDPGTFWLQRELPIDHAYIPPTYDLSGPFRADRRAPITNETQLPTPPVPLLSYRLSAATARPGVFAARITWTDANGETLPSRLTGDVRIAVRWTDENGDNPLGLGLLRIERPTPPPGATGWFAYIYMLGDYFSVHYPREGYGQARPLPLEWTYVQTAAWSSAGDNEYATNQPSFLVQKELPTENTSGIEGPTEAPDAPVVFGASRPPAGTYTAGITEEVERSNTGPYLESELSPLASVTIGQDEVFRIIRRDEFNRVPNGEHKETGADGLPLDHVTVAPDGGARVEGQEMVLQTVPEQTAAEYSSTTQAVDVNANETWRLYVKMSAENPVTGAFQGTAEAALEELNAAGVLTSTSLGSLAVAGHTLVDRIIYASATAGLPAGSIRWQPGTVKAQIKVRFVGTTRNLTVRIDYRTLQRHPHGHRRRKRKGRKRSPPRYHWHETYGPETPIDELTPPDTEEPPVVDPPTDPPGPPVVEEPPEPPAPPEPIPAAQPTLEVWPSPDRPLDTGTPLAPKADFEASMPSWKQEVSGATLTRETSPTITPIAGTYSLRSYKGVA